MNRFNRSLQRHLSLMLGGTILLAGLAAAAASFGLAYLEAKELQDDMLRQIASLAIGAAAEPQLREAARQERDDPDGVDAESRVMVVHLPRDPRPVWLPSDLPPDFNTLNAGVERLRVFVRDGEQGERTVVAQPTEARDEIAINSALRTLIPLLLLLPVLAWLIVRIVRTELAPVTRLSRTMDEQTGDRLDPIAADTLPDEITPFVHAINRLLARVNHLIGQQRRFIADAAHELRSPLTALALQAQNLRQAGSLDAVRERVQVLQAGIERARQLTEQLLSLAGMQAGANRDAEVDVSLVARELIAEYLPVAEAKGIDLGLENTVPLGARASSDLLRLILKNALENALKYTQRGGEVTLRLLSDHGSTVVEVVDNGPGIAASERERVFDPFYRLPGTHGKGSGLGLAIAREAATRLDGTVSLLERHEGHGVVFRYCQKGQT